MSNINQIDSKVCKVFYLLSLFIVNILGSQGFLWSAPQDFGIDYDIVYVRYAATSPTGGYVSIPQGEHPYDITGGADLVLLHPDGSEEIVVDCTGSAAVMDPFISYDAKFVYYSYIENATPLSASWIYKIDLTTRPFIPIRLTFNDGFECTQYSGNTTNSHNIGAFRGIRDMAPVPLADGRILFTSNRAGLIAFHPGTQLFTEASIQQLFVMDDHNGQNSTKALSNLHRLEAASLHQVQHPVQLKDGRILFSTWQDVATKFTYAMTSLFTIYPDGSNLRQFTEPHDHHKNVEHFITQLADEQVVTTFYYPSFDYGFGILLAYPISNPGPDYLRGNSSIKFPYGSQYNVSYRELDRKGMRLITTHTTNADIPAPDLSGKYSMPSATKDGHMLVAYSTGSVNHFDAVCNRPGNYTCDHLRSGVYVIPSAASNAIEDPSELWLMKDDPVFNEIWPRAVVSYQSIFGQEKPDLLPSLSDEPADSRLAPGEAVAILGTSSMYNRDPSDNQHQFAPSSSREIHDGNWTIQGAEAGVFNNSDIYAIRIITTPPVAFTKPIRKWGGDWDRHASIQRYLTDSRLDDVAARYGSLHGERWEILGEFPLTHRSSTDPQGNPDTSWMAKIPADTPTFIQALDQNGITIISELTWRSLKPGEIRVDCGGCHAHSVDPVLFSNTQAGLSSPILNLTGVADDDARIQGGMWDLTTGSIPLLDATDVSFINQRSLDVEFNRDISPILDTHCLSCHSAASANNAGFVLDGIDLNDAYGTITSGSGYSHPQTSKYIRTPQARESLFVWVFYGQRLDGRSNSTRGNDVDYPPSHPPLSIPDQDKRLVARWVDLGCPINFPTTDGFGYTEDNQLPVVNVFSPKKGLNANPTHWKIGVIDTKSGVNWSTLQLKCIPIPENPDDPIVPFILNFNPSDIDSKGVLTIPWPSQLNINSEYILEVSVLDSVGNLAMHQRRFATSEAVSLLKLLQNIRNNKLDPTDSQIDEYLKKYFQ